MVPVVETIADHIIFLGSGISLILALSQVLNRPLNARKVYLLLFFFGMAVMLFQAYLFLGPLGRNMALGAQPVAFSKFLVGPSLYLYLQQLVGRRAVFTRGRMLHFVPAIVSVMMRLAVGATQAYGVSLDSARARFFLVSVPYAYDFAGLFSIFAYMAVIFHKAGIFRMRSIRNTRIETAFVVILASAIVVAGMVIYGLLSGDIAFFRISISLVSLHIVSWLIIGLRYPEFLNLMRREIKKSQYERSLLKNFDQNVLKERLLDLMETEKVYYDPGLSLKSLAAKLLISPHQLSELLNISMKMNFNSFVNTYRVDEAKRLIEERPRESIIKIAFTVGFNTQSVFYSAFLRHVGISPAKYRETSPEKPGGG